MTTMDRVLSYARQRAAGPPPSPKQIKLFERLYKGVPIPATMKEVGEAINRKFNRGRENDDDRK